MSTDLEQPDQPDNTPAVRDEMTSKSPRAQAYNELYNLARLTTNTEMVPKPLRGRPDAAFAVMVYGAELGMEPIASLRSIFLIDGQPTCSAGLMRGLIQGAGHMLVWRHVDNERVELYARRRDSGADGVVTWTLDDARRAKLLGKGNWATYPRAMLAARATSEMARLLFSDVLHGIAYTPEEVGAVGPYAAIDVDYTPTVDRERGFGERNVNKVTGEILDDDRAVDDVVHDDSDHEQLRIDVVDAADAADEQWRADARDDT